MTKNTSTSGIAAGDIYPNRFVKLTSTDFTIAQAEAGERTVGISTVGSEKTPETYYQSDTLQPLATVGRTCSYFQEGTDCMLEVGASDITAGALLAPDANGKAVAVANNAPYGARALAAATSGTLAKVRIEFGTGPIVETPQVQSDWTEADTEDPAFILNKP